MRTLKKTLCLVLALVMCLGLVTVAFADNFDGYTDATEVTHKEAADYLIASGVVEGNGQNQLNPTGTLRRDEAAKMIAYMCLGKAAADAYKANGDPLNDVPKDNWAAGYIQFCVNSNIINGDGTGNFRPADPVTGLEMAKMLLCALGYGVKGEFLQGWPLTTQSKALEVGVFNDVLGSATTDPVNRDNTFQMVFNSMTDIMTVQYNASFDLYFSGSTFTGDQSFSPANTLGYKNFGLIEVSNTDDLGYPVYYWANRYNTSKALTNSYDAYEATNVTVTPQTNATVLAKSLDKHVKVWVNGNNGDNNPYAANGNGWVRMDNTDAADLAVAAFKSGYSVNLVDTEYSFYEYYDAEKKESAYGLNYNKGGNGMPDTLIIEAQFIGKITDAKDKGPDAGLKLSVYSGDNEYEMTLKADYYDANGLKKDDIVVVVPYVGDEATDWIIGKNPSDTPLTLTPVNTNLTPADMLVSCDAATPVVSGVTKFVGGDKANVTFDGKNYEYAANEAILASAGFIAKDGYEFGENTYDFYLNDAGSIIGVRQHTVEAVMPNYIYIDKIQGQVNSNNLFYGSSSEVRAHGYKADGQEITLTLALKDVPRSGISAITSDGENTATRPDDKIDFAQTATTIEKGKYFAITAYAYDAEGKQTAATPTNYQALAGEYTGLAGVYSYTLDNDGNATLSKDKQVKIAGVTYAAGDVSANSSITVKKNTALVTGISGYYANTATKLYVAGKGAVTTYDGYANFPANKSWTVKATPAATGEVAAIFYLTAESKQGGKSITSIVVVTDEPESVADERILALGEANAVIGTNDKGDKVYNYTFYTGAVGEDGRPETVTLASKDELKTLEKGIYKVTVDKGEISGVPTKVDQNIAQFGNNQQVVVGKAKEVSAGQIVIGDDNYSVTTTEALNTTEGNPMDWALKAVEEGYTVVLVADKDAPYKVSAAFITEIPGQEQKPGPGEEEPEGPSGDEGGEEEA